MVNDEKEGRQTAIATVSIGNKNDAAKATTARERGWGWGHCTCNDSSFFCYTYQHQTRDLLVERGEDSSSYMEKV